MTGVWIAAAARASRAAWYLWLPVVLLTPRLAWAQTAAPSALSASPASASAPASAAEAVAPDPAAQLEGQALVLAGQALFGDYQQRNPGAALEKLNRAIALCAATCRPEVLAVLYRDRGVVHTGAAQSDYVAGMASFRRAVELDPTLGLAPEFSTHMIRKAYAEARGFAHGGEGLALRNRLAVQIGSPYAVNTALSVSARTSAEITQVRVYFKTKAMTAFEAVQLEKRSATDFHAEWPCERVVDNTRIDYFVVATGYDNRVLATSGSEKAPLLLKGERTAATPLACPVPLAPVAPTLVWTHTAPAQQTTFTPLPLFVEAPPGTQKVMLHYRVVRGEYASVEMQAMEAGFGYQVPCQRIGRLPGEFLYYFSALAADGSELGTRGSAMDPYAVRIETQLDGPRPSFPGQAPPVSCQTVDDCPPDFPGCNTKSKTPGTATEKAEVANWLELTAALDFLALGSTAAACGGSGGTDYACYVQEREQPRESVGINGNGLGDVSSGFSLATQRLLLGYHRALNEHLEVGARLGLALGGGPEPSSGDGFTPVHAEVRAAYSFSSQAEHARFGPFLEASGGVAQVDSVVKTEVLVDASSGECAARQRGCVLELDAWRRAGRAFGALGAGLRLATFEDQAVMLSARGVLYFPTQAFGTAVQLGYRVGF